MSARLAGIEHLRVLAAVFVLFWCFIHPALPYGLLTDFAPLSLLEEGHTGASLFFVLTGFALTWTCYGRPVNYRAFLKNRFLRLFPLIFLSFIIAHQYDSFGTDVVKDFLLLTGHGGVYNMWAVVIAIQFYLFYPCFADYVAKEYGAGQMKYFPFLGLIALGYLIRIAVYAHNGIYQNIAFLTIVGRIDQLALGCMTALLLKDADARMAAKSLRKLALGLIPASLALLVVSVHWMNGTGGYAPGAPSNSTIWLFHSTMEGLCYAALTFGWIVLSRGWNGKCSRGFAYLGALAFPACMFQQLTVPLARALSDRWQITAIGGDLMVGAMVGFFVLMLPLTFVLAALLHEVIEKPVLRRRSDYLG